MDRRGDVVRQPRRADDPVLHLLLDVRLPAGRRPRLGRRRQPRARVPARRHRGAHDAERRGPAARGRPQPPPGVDDPELRRLRPDVRLRGRGDRPGRPAADVRRAGGRLLLPHADERELPAPGDARGRRGGHPARACTCCAERRGRRPAGAAARLGHDPARGARRRRAAARATSASRPTSGASRRSPSCAATASTAERWNRLHPTRTPRRPYVERVARRTRRGPVVAATDYMRALRRPDPRRGCRRRYACSAPTASAAATTARDAAPLLRGRPPLRRGRGAEARSPTTGDGRAHGGRRGDRAVRIDPETRRRPGRSERD